MEPLRAALLYSGAAGGPIDKPWCKVAGPIVLPMTMYRTSERGDGMFDMFKDAPEGARARVRHRESVKLQFLLFEMARRLAKAPDPKDPKGGAGGAGPAPAADNGGLSDDETAPEDLVAPLESLFILPVRRPPTGFAGLSKTRRSRSRPSAKLKSLPSSCLFSWAPPRPGPGGRPRAASPNSVDRFEAHGIDTYAYAYADSLTLTAGVS